MDEAERMPPLTPAQRRGTGVSSAIAGIARSRIALAALLLLLVPYLRVGFVLDDFLHLERVVRGAGWAALDYRIRSDDLGIQIWWLPGGVEFHFLRPLVLLLLKLEAGGFGLHPLPFHAVSIALHMGNVLLCGAIGRRLGLSASAARLAALAWGVSIHAVAAVGWVSGQSELLVACFVLSAVFAYLRGMETGQRRWRVLSIAALALGLLSKESAVVGPLLVLAAHRAARSVPLVRSAGAKSTAWYPASLVVLVGLYLAVRFVVLDFPAPPPPYFDAGRSVGDVARLAIKTLRYAAGATFGIPVLPLVLDRGPATIAVAAAGVTACVLNVRLSRRRAPWELGWFVAALAPYLLVMPTSLYLYLALCGVYWLIARAVQRGSVVAGVLAGWLVVSGVAGHVIAGVAFPRVVSEIRAATSALQESVVPDGRDVVLVNAPFWSYALPSLLRLEDPPRDIRLHVVSFSPEFRGGAARAQWTSGGSLLVAGPPGGFFRSPVERFFQFGANPCGGKPDAEPVVVVTCGGSGGDTRHPEALVVELRDRVPGGRPVVLAFDGWTAREIRP